MWNKHSLTNKFRKNVTNIYAMQFKNGLHP